MTERSLNQRLARDPGPRDRFTASSQNGKKGHCMVAQVFGPDGLSVATFESTEDPILATTRAKLLAGLLNRVERKPNPDACEACVGSGEDWNEGNTCHACGGTGKKSRRG